MKEIKTRSKETRESRATPRFISMESVSEQSQEVKHLGKQFNVKLLTECYQTLWSNTSAAQLSSRWSDLALHTNHWDSVLVPTERLAAIRLPVTECHFFIYITLVFRQWQATPKVNILLWESQYFTITVGILNHWFKRLLRGNHLLFYTHVYCCSLARILKIRVDL